VRRLERSSEQALVYTPRDPREAGPAILAILNEPARLVDAS